MSQKTNNWSLWRKPKIIINHVSATNISTTHKHIYCSVGKELTLCFIATHSTLETEWNKTQHMVQTTFVEVKRLNFTGCHNICCHTDQSQGGTSTPQSSFTPSLLPSLKCYFPSLIFVRKCCRRDSWQHLSCSHLEMQPLLVARIIGMCSSPISGLI